MKRRKGDHEMSGSPAASTAASMVRAQAERSTLTRLEDLDVPAEGQRPDYNWSTLVIAAINSAPDGKLALQGIYEALSAWCSLSNDSDDVWKTAIRHSLTTRACFVRCRAEEDRGRWRVDHAVEPTKLRPRVRRLRPTKRTLAQRIDESNHAQARQFLDMIIGPEAGLHVERGYALSFDRNSARTIVTALSHYMLETDLQASCHIIAERLDHAPTLAVLGKRKRHAGGPAVLTDGKEGSETVSDPPVLASSAAVLPVMAQAAVLVHSIMNDQHALFPLPPGIGNKTMQAGYIEKPTHHLPQVLRDLVLASPQKRLSTAHLFENLEGTHSYYRQSLSDSWKNNVRAILSLHECFVKDSKPGRVDYWTIDESIPISATKTNVPLRQPEPSRPASNGHINVIRMADVPAQLAAIAAKQADAKKEAVDTKV